MIDLFTHHNELAGADQVRFGGYRFDGCSAYGSIVALGDSELLAICDCFSKEQSDIYVVRTTIG